MTPTEKARGRLDEMINRGAKILSTRQAGDWGTEHLGNQSLYAEWRLSARTALQALDSDGRYVTDFDDADTKPFSFGFGYPQKLERQVAALKAFAEDFDGGYLSSIRNLVRAEVFADFLEQAQHLFELGYWQPVPLIVGAVLEDHLRKLTAKYPSIVIPTSPKLDGMNAELVKAGEYGVLEQKRITVWADIRNKAAHAKWTEYKEHDAEGMLRDVPSFLIAHKLP